MRPETEQQILEQAMTAVNREAGLRLTVGEFTPRTRDGRHYHALIRLPGQNVGLAAEIKKWAQYTNLGALIDQINKLPRPGLLVADFINPRMAEKLRAEDVQFIDTAGNAYLNIPPTYIYIRGNRPDNDDLKHNARRTALGRAFTATGLRVVFAFLRNPELVNTTYRDIADVAGVAIGTVGWVINNLKANRYIADWGNHRGRQLIEYRGLLERWTETYPEKLRPKQMIGAFEAPNANWWKETNIQDFNAFWGGEIAAAKLTRFLTPEVITIYVTEGDETELIRAHKLRKAEPKHTHHEARLVYLYKTFWHDKEVREELVDPVLVYADLIATADARNNEAANLIFEKYIAKRIAMIRP